MPYEVIGFSTGIRKSAGGRVLPDRWYVYDPSTNGDIDLVTIVIGAVLLRLDRSCVPAQGSQSSTESRPSPEPTVRAGFLGHALGHCRAEERRCFSVIPLEAEVEIGGDQAVTGLLPPKAPPYLKPPHPPATL